MNFYSGVIRHGVLPCVSLATRSEFWSLYKDLERRESQPRRSAPSDVLQRVSSLLAHAYESVPFYRARMQAAGLTADAAITLDDLRRLPPTTKADVAANFPDGLVSSKPVHEPWKYSASSGTINRITVVQDFRKRDFTRATQLLALRASGYRAGMKYLEIPPNVCMNVCGVGASVEPNVFKYALEAVARRTVFDAEVQSNLKGFAERQLVYRRLELPSFGPEGLAQPDANLDAYLQQMDRYRPYVVKALPLYLYLLALRIEEGGIRPRIDGGVMPMGSLMTPHMKRVVERAFGCPVYEDYGTTEFGNIAVECGERNGLHPFSDLFLLEVVRPGRAATAGEKGRLLVTDLWNYAMPLIRYDIGDVASFQPGPCACGRTDDRLALHGRAEDCLVAEDGSLVTSDRIVETILANQPGLRGFRVDQRRAKELDVHVVARQGQSVHPDDVSACLAGLVGRSTRILTRMAGTIVPEPNGKYRFVRNFTNAPLYALQSATQPC